MFRASLVALLLAAAPPEARDRSPGFDRPPEGCLDMDDPRIQNAADPRRRKYQIEICCLAPDDPRAFNPDDPRRKKYREYGVRVCGPDVRALMFESRLRHGLAEELAELNLETLARDGSTQQLRVRAVFEREERAAYRVGSGELEGLALWSAGLQQKLYVPGFGAPKRVFGADLKERFADTDFSFADFLRHDPEYFDYYFRGTEGEGEDLTHIFSALPRDELGSDYPYHGQQIWLRARDLTVLKMRMFDRANHPWKEIRFEELVEVAPGVKRANRIVVEDQQRRHRTVVRVLSRSTDAGLNPAWLDPARFHEPAYSAASRARSPVW